MTKLESIIKDRVWKGATVEADELHGRPAWRITHPKGAVALVYQDAGRIQVRHWEAYMEVVWWDQCAARAGAAWVKEERAKAAAHFRKLSGFTMGGP
jgi:hypothetical protein